MPINIKLETAPFVKSCEEAAAGMEAGFKSALGDVKKTVRTEVRRQFETSGGGSWAPVTARTLKGRKVNTANQPLIDTGELMKSLTEEGAAHAILSETPTEITIGTDRADANRHQFGVKDGKEPLRAFLYVSDQEEADILAVFQADMDVRISRVVR